jgi:hypothetical protein
MEYLSMIKLICKKVEFYSRNDESAFFEWIAKIRVIKKWEGVGDEIHLYVPKTIVSKTSLRDLMALFFRYKINMRQLQQLVNDKNRDFFMNTKKYWYKRIFGNIEVPL